MPLLSCLHCVIILEILCSGKNPGPKIRVSTFFVLVHNNACYSIIFFRFLRPMSDKKMKKIDATPFGSSMPDVGMDSFSENVIQNDTTG